MGGANSIPFIWVLSSRWSVSRGGSGVGGGSLAGGAVCVRCRTDVQRL